jgi:hypothetical protein
MRLSRALLAATLALVSLSVAAVPAAQPSQCFDETGF